MFWISIFGDSEVISFSDSRDFSVPAIEVLERFIVIKDVKIQIDRPFPIHNDMQPKKDPPTPRESENMKNALW